MGRMQFGSGKGPRIHGELVHHECAFNPGGATKELCLSRTRSPANNRHCRARSCACPLRACWACLLQGVEPGNVVEAAEGLCEFHQKNGTKARQPTELPDRHHFGFQTGYRGGVGHS